MTKTKTKTLTKSQAAKLNKATHPQTGYILSMTKTKTKTKTLTKSQAAKLKEGTIVQLLAFIDEGELIEGACKAEFLEYQQDCDVVSVCIIKEDRQDGEDGIRECDRDQVQLIG